MTEPDPCPFERADLLTENSSEGEKAADTDLLANCEDSSDERPVIHQSLNRATENKLKILDHDRVSSRSSQKSIGQDMVEPMHAGVDTVNSEADVSVNSIHNEVSINRIGTSKVHNLLL